MNWRNIIISELIERDGDKCKICNKEFSELAPAEIDHIIPIHFGGKDKINNLQLLHNVCNKKKGIRRKGNAIKDLNNNKVNLVFRSSILGEKIIFMTLTEVQKGLFEKKSLEKIGQELGMTRRQIGYLLRKYHLSKNPYTWNLTDKLKVTNSNNS